MNRAAVRSKNKSRVIPANTFITRFGMAPPLTVYRPEGRSRARRTDRPRSGYTSSRRAGP
jgi:hypothetical protein